MPRLKLPLGTGNVAYGTWQFTPDDTGCIETGDAPPDVVAAITAHTGAREATVEDATRVDLAAIEATAVKELATTKEGLLAELADMGVRDVDGRKSLAVLTRKRDEAIAARDARAANDAADAAKKAAQEAARQAHAAAEAEKTATAEKATAEAAAKAASADKPAA